MPMWTWTWKHWIERRPPGEPKQPPGEFKQLSEHLLKQQRRESFVFWPTMAVIPASAWMHDVTDSGWWLVVAAVAGVVLAYVAIFGLRRPGGRTFGG